MGSIGRDTRSIRGMIPGCKQTLPCYGLSPYFHRKLGRSYAIMAAVKRVDHAGYGDGESTPRPSSATIVLRQGTKCFHFFHFSPFTSESFCSSPNHVGSSPNHVAAATEKSGQDEEHDRDASASNRAVMAIALRDMLHSRDLRAFDDATRVERGGVVPNARACACACACACIVDVALANYMDIDMRQGTRGTWTMDHGTCDIYGDI